jgi:hypothetical protein
VIVYKTAGVETGGFFMRENKEFMEKLAHF